MSKPIRLQILDELQRCLSNIQVYHGYQNDVEAVYRRYKELEYPVYPHMFVVLGAESRIDESESGTLKNCTMDAYIIASIEVATDISEVGLLTEAAESLIEDIDNNINQSPSVESYCLLNKVPGVIKWDITAIEPYVDDVTNKAALMITVTINYRKSF